MRSQSHRRFILAFALIAVLAGVGLLQAIATTRAAAGNSGSMASGIIYPPNDPPVASDFSVSVTVGTPATGMLGSHVVEPENETMTFFATSATKGTVTVDEITGAFSYTAFPAAFGTDSFTYYAKDPQQNQSNNATVTVTINRRPTAANQSITVTAGNVFNGQLQGSDLDGDALTYVIVGQPTKGFATLDSNGAFTYVPNTGATGSDSFTFTVNDGKGSSNVATVAVTIQPTPPTNRAPTAASQSITATVGVAFNGQLQGSDLDGNALTYVIVSQPSKGSLTLGATGTFVYTPNTTTGSDSFTYKVNDGNLDSNVATVSITVTQATLIITADNKTKVAGTATPVLTVTYSGFVNGDTAASLDTPVSIATTATINSPAGAYPITVSGASDANYTIIFVSGTLTVTASGPVLDPTNGITGAPGSYFRLQAGGFTPHSLLVITVNGRRVGTVTSNTNGVAVFILFFSVNDKPGIYTIVVTENTSLLSVAAAKSAQIILTLDTSAPKLANPGGAPVLDALPKLYLSLMSR